MIDKKINEGRKILKAFAASVNENSANLSSIEVARMLSLYSFCLSDPQSELFLLKYGFEKCLTKLFRVMSGNELKKLVPKFLFLTFDINLSDRALKEFDNTIEYAFNRMSKDELHDDSIKKLLSIMPSENRIKSIFACRYLSHLIDVHQNFDEFLIPIIFYEIAPYKFKIGNGEDTDDMKLILSLENLIKSAIVWSIKRHHESFEIKNGIFKLLSLLIINYPTFSMTIMIIGILLELQKVATESNPSKFKFHIHALVVSIMTLLSWLFRAKPFTNYINDILILRMSELPCLIPPLKESYDAESHDFQIAPKFLFDKWELSYCLRQSYNMNEQLLSAERSKESQKKSKKRFAKFFSFK
jgi:hypothetical protein